MRRPRGILNPLHKKTGILLGAAVVVAGILGWWAFRHRGATNRIPGGLADQVPSVCRQLVVVRPRHMERPEAEVYLLERSPSGGLWQVAAGPWEAVVGRNGTGWGEGTAPLEAPSGYVEKQEGDGRSPAGLFALAGIFGRSDRLDRQGFRMPWQECVASLRGVDDPGSRYYNQVVDENAVADPDWNSAEIMRREDGLYDAGALIGHNPRNQPGAGSCIFLHIWKGPGQGTAGCTALKRDHVLQVLQWLDPAFHPHLVLAVP